MKDRDDLIESRIERIMGDDKLLRTEINELDVFQDGRVIEALQREDDYMLGKLVAEMIRDQVTQTAIQEIDEEAADREEARAVDRYESRMENAA